ncbi:MAG: 50S ribosomal protein L25 [Chloroflexi bacterium]|nr:50S ribosomal protein L25 [Chloroflexota bacterium]MDA0246272.1 50S ribosomal protein L25 [Chloroflexota bacterium]
MSSVHTKLVGDERTIIGKQVRQLRRAGLIPAVLYGHRDPISLQLNALQTTLALRKADDNAIVDLEIAGNVYTALIRQIQYHPTRREITHIDFLEVSKDQMVEAEVQLILAGQLPFPERLSGTAQILLHAVQIEAKPDDLVSEIEVDLSKMLNHEMVLTVADLVAPAGVVILTEGDIAVAKFEFERVATAEDTTAA